MIWVILIFFGAFLSLLLSAGQFLLRNKKSKNYLLGALLFCVGGWQFHTGLFFSELKSDFAFYTFYNLPLLFLTGPLLYYYFRQLMGSNPRLGYLALLHAIPAAAVLVYLMPFYTRGLECKADFLAGYATLCGPLTAAPVQIMILMALVSMSLYLAMTLVGATKMLIRRGKATHGAEWLTPVFIAVNTGNTLLCLWGIIYPSPALVKASAVTVTGVLCFLFLTGLRYERYLNVARIEAERVRYEKSRLGDIDLKTLLHKLDVLMREKHLYRNENLTLVQLAGEMGIAVQQLSEAINKGLGKNFYQFINEYRIAAACEALIAEPDRNVLDIAFAVGFNSKSVFNRVFTQLKAVTPSEFRQRHSGKSA